MYVEGPVAIDLFCPLIFALSITEILLREVDAHFSGHFARQTSSNSNVWGKYLAESSGKMCMKFAQRYLRNGLDIN